jgi:hypothetical protein
VPDFIIFFSGAEKKPEQNSGASRHLQKKLNFLLTANIL